MAALDYAQQYSKELAQAYPVCIIFRSIMEYRELYKIQSSGC